MNATWRTEVVFSLSTMEAERLHDLLDCLLKASFVPRTIVTTDKIHPAVLTDDEQAYVRTFLRLLRDPANTVTRETTRMPSSQDTENDYLGWKHPH